MCSFEELKKNLGDANRKLQLLPKVNKLAWELYENRLFDLDVKTLEMIVNENRASGKTSAKVLETIADAIKNPNSPIRIVSDHLDSPPSNRMMGEYVKETIAKLGYKFLDVNLTDNTLTYKI